MLNRGKEIKNDIIGVIRGIRICPGNLGQEYEDEIPFDR